jgi:hypothetical protein
MPIGTIDLQPDEQALLDNIEFDVLALEDYPDVAANAEWVCALTESLIARGAIPEDRRRYFTDPDFHVGGRKSSRLQIFQRNGNQCDEVFKHPHFLPYLHYFIHGADLPAPAVTSFQQAVERCGMVTSSDIVPLGKHARALTRAHKLPAYLACEEFFKLAIDLGVGLMAATMIRNSVRTVR